MSLDHFFYRKVKNKELANLGAHNGVLAPIALYGLLMRYPGGESWWRHNPSTPDLRKFILPLGLLSNNLLPLQHMSTWAKARVLIELCAAILYKVSWKLEGLLTGKLKGKTSWKSLRITLYRRPVDWYHVSRIHFVRQLFKISFSMPLEMSKVCCRQRFSCARFYASNSLSPPE